MSSNRILDNIRAALGKKEGLLTGPRPPILPARQAGKIDEEIERFFSELRLSGGTGGRVDPSAMEQSLMKLIAEEDIHKATTWHTPFLYSIELEKILHSLKIELVSPNAPKQEMALCDLGITEADFLLPETGTLGLYSSAEKPRGVSLLPRVHLAVVRKQALRADLQQVFAEARDNHYLVFISGPSRTADIELTVTLGVHGPKKLYVWMVD